jgi:type I restriction enzyme S subunit
MAEITTSKLGALGSVLRGVTFNAESDFRPLGSENSIELLRSNNVQSNSLFLRDTYNLSLEKVNRNQILLEGDLLICMANGSKELVGKSAYVDSINSGKYTFGSFMGAFRPNDSKTGLYIKYILQSEGFRNHINLILAGSSINNLTPSLIEDYEFVLPDLNEQKAIAKALSDIDDLIEQTSEQLLKQTNLFSSVSEKLLNPLNNTEVKFQSYSLGKLGTTFGGLNGKSGKDFGKGYAYVTFLNVMNNLVLNPATVDYVQIGASEVQNRLRENDLVFNGSSETPEEAGLTSVVPLNLEGAYLNSFCFGFRFSEIKEIDPKYFALLSRSFVGRQIIGLLAQGSTRYNISKTELLKAQWPIPAIDIQRKTVEILSDILSLIENTKLTKAKYECIKQGMAHDLLTGKVRLV